MAIRNLDKMTKSELIKALLQERNERYEIAKIKDDHINILNEKVIKDENQINSLNAIVTKSEDHINSLNVIVTKSEDHINQANGRIDELVTELAKVLYKLKYLQQMHFSSQRNKIVENQDQISLFSIEGIEIPDGVIIKSEAEEITIPEYTRKKNNVSKTVHIDYSELPHEYVEHQLNEEDYICDNCGNKMKIKKYNERAEIIIEPAKLFVKIHRNPVLECEHCQEVNEDGKSTYKTITKVKPLFSRSKCSASLLSYIMDMKYNKGLPLYTLEKDFLSRKAIIPRQNMANWLIRSVNYINPLYEIMRKDLLKSNVIHADETTTQVLNEENKPSTSKSYMFVYRSNKYVDNSIILYDYRASRSKEGPLDFLGRYKGILITDAYQGYNAVPNIQHSYCHAHALRKFKDAYKIIPVNENKKASFELSSIKQYQEFFRLEDKIEKEAVKKFSDNIDKQIAYIQQERLTRLLPKFNEFLLWLDSIRYKTSSIGMRGAIKYVINNKNELSNFILDGKIDLTNNSTEQKIRLFATNRARNKFYVSSKGADASAKIYSLIITAEENGMSAYMYLEYLFEQIPNIDIKNEDELRKLLPYSKSIPDYCKQRTKKELKQKIKKLDNNSK